MAVIGVIAWLILSFGGLGGMMYIGLLAENFIGRDVGWITGPLWVLFAALLLLWWGSVAAVAIRARSFLSWASALSGKPKWSVDEWLIAFGHMMVVLAGANAALFPKVMKNEFVYGFLLLGATSYAAGLLVAFLAARSARTSLAGESRPVGSG